MHADGVAFLELCKQRALDRIADLMNPADEAAFRSWVHSYTARQPSDAGRVQGTRDSWQAERVADYMLEYHRVRESKVQALQREIDRLDMVLSGEVEFMNSMKALAWCREW
jgi:hypothetical protein